MYLKRILFALVVMFCVTGFAISGYALTYECGDADGDPWDDGNYTGSVNTLDATDVLEHCTPGTGQTLDIWLCGEETITPGDPITLTVNTTCTAQWDCDNAGGYWWNTDHDVCVRGYEITLVSDLQWSIPPIPEKLYTIRNTGIYLDANRTQKMEPKINGEGGANPIVVPTIHPTKVIYDKNAPFNPVTGERRLTQTNYQTVNLQRTMGQVEANSINSDGYISETGEARAKEINKNTTWKIYWTRVGNQYRPEDIPGYTFDGWYDENNESLVMVCTGDMPEEITVYGHWTPNTYNIEYNLGPDADWQSGYNPTTTVTYDTQFNVGIPVRDGYTFAGWNISGMHNVTHYYGDSDQPTSYTAFSESSLNGINKTYFMNLTSIDGDTVTFEAQWDCADGYHLDSATGECINTYTLTYDCNDVNSNTFDGGDYTGSVNTLDATDVLEHCAPGTGQTLDTWLCGEETITPGNPITLTANTTCTAQWKCDNANNYFLVDDVCEPGYTITLTDNGCANFWTPPVPSVLYTIHNVGVFTGSERTTEQLMEPRQYGVGGKNPIQAPYVTFTYDRDIDTYVPTNPITETKYSPINPTTSLVYDSENPIGPVMSNYYFFFTPYIDQAGYIVNIEYSGNYWWNATNDIEIDSKFGSGCTDDLDNDVVLPGYTVEWYDAQNNKITKKPCSSSCSISIDGTIYAKYKPNTYNVEYVLNGGYWSGNEIHQSPETHNYDEEFMVGNLVRDGYTFAGWNISDMDSVTHYYGDSDQPTSYTSLTETSANNVKQTWFMNLRSTSGTVTFEAQWDCDAVNGYYWDSTHTLCINDYSITYSDALPEGVVANDMPNPSIVSVLAGTTGYQLADLPTATGYLCVGWSCTDASNKAVSVIENKITMPASSVACSAIWDCDASNGYRWVDGLCKRTYSVAYSCGSASGNPPATNTSAIYGQPFVVADNTCDVPYFAIFSGWEVSGTDGDIVTDTFVWEYLENKIFTALYECDNLHGYYWDRRSSQCVFVCNSGKFLHIGTDKMCLYINKPTWPALVVKIGTETYYLSMHEADLKINDHSDKKFKISYDGQIYNVHDISVSPAQ